MGSSDHKHGTTVEASAVISSWHVIMAVVAFSVVFGCVIMVKLHQEWTAARTHAEASRARTAAFIAEQVASRLSAVQGALTMAASQLEAINPTTLNASVQAGLDNLVQASWVDAAALLTPDDRLVAAGTASPEALRKATDAALSVSTSLAVRPDRGAPLVIAVPARLADGSVGALIASLKPQDLLPNRNSNDVAMLIDDSGRLLAVNPPIPLTDAPFAADYLELNADDITRMADQGGAMQSGETHILGVAPIPDTSLHALSLGPDRVNLTAWKRSLIFHLLLFLAPVGTAMALSVMLQNQIRRLIDTQARLRASESRLGLAMEGARCGVWEWDMESDDVIVTDSFAQLIGRVHGGALAGSQLLLLLEPEDRSRMRDALQDAVRAPGVNLEVQVVADSPIWLQLRGRLMSDRTHIIGVAIDITERKNAQLRAEEANRSKSEFLANMSHELRTPLNAINGFSEIMADEMFGPLGHKRYREYVRDILGSGQHLLSLINDILDMSKIEAGKMQLQPEPLMLGEVIRQCARIVQTRAAKKQIELIVEGGDLPQISADPRALRQILLNLMSNAVKFTPEGGCVRVRSFHTVDDVTMQVVDNGIGISEEDLPRVGRPFEQIENQHSKTHQGSGLGLALSKSLVELHGGTLRIESRLGEGVTVSFTLPADITVADKIPSKNPEPVLPPFKSCM